MLTFGEGYHNYHHTFANDYRNGVRWYHFDPTKWLIWILNKAGLTSDLKQMSPYAIKKKMVLERKNLLMEHLKSSCWQMAEELESQVNEISDRIVAQITHFNQLKEQYRQLKRSETKEKLEEQRRAIKTLRKNLKVDWKRWSQLSRQILKGKPSLETAS